MHERRIWSLGGEDPLKKEMATTPVSLPVGSSPKGRQKVGCKLAAKQQWCTLAFFTHTKSSKWKMCVKKRGNVWLQMQKFVYSMVTLLLFSCEVVSNPLQLHDYSLPCPSLSSGAHSISCPSSWWRHPTISSSVVPFSCPQSFPASGCFLMSQLFLSGDQSIEASASASVLPLNIQG